MRCELISVCEDKEEWGIGETSTSSVHRWGLGIGHRALRANTNSKFKTCTELVEVFKIKKVRPSIGLGGKHLYQIFCEMRDHPIFLGHI
jgi:hypothetical protein